MLRLKIHMYYNMYSWFVVLMYFSWTPMKKGKQ